jgi:hypothetical protein
MNTKKYQFPRREEEGVSLPKIEGMQDITDSHSKQLYIGNLQYWDLEDPSDRDSV